MSLKIVKDTYLLITKNELDKIGINDKWEND